MDWGTAITSIWIAFLLGMMLGEIGRKGAAEVWEDAYKTLRERMDA